MREEIFGQDFISTSWIKEGFSYLPGYYKGDQNVPNGCSFMWSNRPNADYSVVLYRDRFS